MQTSQSRHFAELVFPGCMIGLTAGAVAGAVGAVAGLPTSTAVLMVITLGVPLAVFGAGYNLLLAAGKIRLGGVAPAAIYWALAFPVARFVDELALDFAVGRAMGLPEGVLPFLAYQALISVGYAIGFIWMHEYVFPRWWLRVRTHNPVANRYVEQYKHQASRMQRRKDASPPGGRKRQKAH